MGKIEELIQQYCPDGVAYHPLGDYVNVSIGEFVRKDKQSPDAAYPVYNGRTTYTGLYDQYNMEGPKVIMSARGNAGFVNYVETNFWCGNSCYAMYPSSQDLNWKFLYYYLKQQEQFFLHVMSILSGFPYNNVSMVQVFQHWQRVPFRLLKSPFPHYRCKRR